MSWRIMASTPASGAEEIDTTDSEADAKYLANEYQLAYGKAWHVWVERIKT